MDLDLMNSGLLDKLTKKQLFGEEKILDEDLKYELSKYGIRFTKKGTIDKRALSSKKKPIKAQGSAVIDTRPSKDIGQTTIEAQLESDNEELPSFGDRIKASMGKHGTLVITDSDEEFQNEILGTYAKDLISKLQLRQDKKLQPKILKTPIIEDTSENEDEEDIKPIKIKKPIKVQKGKKIIKTKVKQNYQEDAENGLDTEEEEEQIPPPKKITKKIIKPKPKIITPSDSENEIVSEEEIQPKKEVKKKTVKKPKKIEKVSTAWTFENTF